MEWLVTFAVNSWVTIVPWMVGLAVGFGIMSCLTPCNPGMSWWKDLRAVAADLMYWLIAPLFLEFGRRWMLSAGVLLLFGGAQPGFAAVKELPLWQQCVLILLIQDVILYASHRIFHSRMAWKFHAVHHSPKVVDWMTTARFHPVNHLLAFGLADVAVLLMGFPREALLALAPFTVIYSAMVHANLNWTFGPLKYLLASPVFHRWHHTTEEAGLNKNFASTFPILDVIFGTFYMPAGKVPEQFGNGEPDYPEGFWGQLVHPFRKQPTPPAPPPPTGSRRPIKQRTRRRAA
jgi:sterol desaturase/sphingolipid hydroxylase (fatty acid hydroxylase superfamily)